MFNNTVSQLNWYPFCFGNKSVNFENNLINVYRWIEWYISFWHSLKISSKSIGRVWSYAQLKLDNQISNFPTCKRCRSASYALTIMASLATFLADDKMVFNKDDLSLITILRQEWHYEAKYILQEFPKKLTITSLNRLIAKVDTTGPADKWYGGGRPRTARTTGNVEAVQAHVLSQEDWPGTHITIP